MKKYINKLFGSIKADVLQKITFWTSFSIVLLNILTIIVNLFGFSIFGNWIIEGERLVVSLFASCLLAGLDFGFWKIIKRLTLKEEENVG